MTTFPTTVPDFVRLGQAVAGDDYSRMGLGELAKIHNEWSENDHAADWHLSARLLENPLLREAIGNAKTIVEIGHHRAITLDQIARMHSPQTLVLGVDANPNYIPIPESFYPSNFREMLERAEELGFGYLFNPMVLGAKPAHKIYGHNGDMNAFLANGFTAEQLLAPNAPADIVVMKFMLGYLGNTPEESLAYLQRNILPHAKEIFIADYIGRANYSKAQIPTPEQVASVVSASLPGAKPIIEKGQNYFTLYAGR